MNASKIVKPIIKKEVSSTFNSKLKSMVKSEMQRDLLEDKNNKNSSNTKTDDYGEIIRDKGGKAITKAVALLPLKWVAIGVAVLLLLLMASSAVSSVTSILATGSQAKPNIDEEHKTILINLMEKLDKNCSKQLTSNFTLEGNIDTDWRAVLALTLGYYENDLSGFNEDISVSGGVPLSGDYADIINFYAAQNSLDPYIVCGVIMKESTWDPNAGSPAGAVGLMQLMEATAIENGCFDRYDPRQNIMAGCRYLRKCYDYFPNDERLALASYNAGPGNAEEYINTVPETMEYPGKVLGYAEQYRNGTLQIPGSNGGTSSVTTTEKGKMQTIYEAVNVVSADHKTLNRKSFEEVVHELNFNDDQVTMANVLYESNLWTDVFGDDFDFSFKINGNFSSGGSNITNGVVFVNGSRPGNQKVIDLALSQLGNSGGQPYCNDYGFSGRVEWCSVFTWWCYNNSDCSNVFPSKVDVNCAYCPSMVSYWKSVGKFGDKNYRDLAPGDCIYFDYENDGTSDHVGLVIGRDEEWVYTVEGNSNDMVAERKYKLDSNMILGYGLVDPGN